MERLTRKITGRYWSDYSANECVDKLGQLEDIEEELGIELSVLFKALKNGIYVKPKYDRIFHNTFIAITKDLNGEYYFYEEETEFIYLKDYGKTWSLDRKELEK